ncbi:TetR/AcrR family transcriptional regulator C-terminal domain-containing protein [Mesorhizobium sp. PAMC28654]|uniref:TetR/AcrR family transcriptional regulator C-terminal domain-containing protein n=1 Tax=Mesorhizobium sp. PAMC28654 TaxID=2880934 RepID=UPI001D0BD4A6|nr:TetR/AcrR family transcriptional regulator C-terminal domain-containing protein [Mesorhizobium sp. PAMC28654]UDL91226.1 TetR/AcrR family transcriptional regulator C-terminal domain-containing protein [Mesorhizobium sp. PAMC28654]
MIVAEALSLLNEVGMDALSTRLLAERLKVQQPALYWHFRNKRTLLDAMNDELLRRGHKHRAPRQGEDWRDFVRNNARSFRGALIAYRDGARVHAGTEANAEDLGHFEGLLHFMMGEGMIAHQAMDLLLAVGRYTVGCVMEEQADAPEGPGRGAALDAAAEPYPLLHSALSHYRVGGHEAQFESGLDLLIAGTEAKMNKAL